MVDVSPVAYNLSILISRKDDYMWKYDVDGVLIQTENALESIQLDRKA